MSEHEPRVLPVDPVILEELPGTSARSLLVPAPWAAADVRGRMRAHADRLDGPRALALRAAPTPSAYRALFRQLGIEPDTDLPPLDRLLLHRMRRGGFPRRDPLRDVLDLAVLETSVPVWALAADAPSGPVVLRLAHEGEALGAQRGTLPGPEPIPLEELSPGHVVLADDDGPLQAVFGPAAVRALPEEGRGLLLVALGAPAVSDLAVEEALWTCQEALTAP